MRRKLHEALESEEIDTPVMNGAFHSAAIAISTLIVFNMGNGKYATLVRQRSSGVGNHSDLLHVIPSAMFQPLIGDLKNEFSVELNIYKEYLEEVFSNRNLEKDPGEKKYDFFIDDLGEPDSVYPDLQYLRKMILEEKTAQLIPTGVAVNLLRDYKAKEPL